MEARARPLAGPAWLTALVFAAVFAGVRVIGTLGPRSVGWVLPAGFVLMAILPYLLLQAPARREMGLKLPADSRIYLVGIFAGAIAAFACFALGTALFGVGEDNWFVSIANNYRRAMNTAGWDVLRLQLVFTIPAMVFSPIGEEIFFRGYLQYALEQRFSARASTVIECSAFAVVHLCHHGLFIAATGVGLLPVSGLIWVLLMFGAALTFAWLRRHSGSLLPAIVSHATFNLVMNLAIFGYLWRANP